MTKRGCESCIFLKGDSMYSIVPTGGIITKFISVKKIRTIGCLEGHTITPKQYLEGEECNYIPNIRTEIKDILTKIGRG